MSSDSDYIIVRGICMSPLFGKRHAWDIPITYRHDTSMSKLAISN